MDSFSAFLASGAQSFEAAMAQPHEAPPQGWQGPWDALSAGAGTANPFLFMGDVPPAVVVAAPPRHSTHPAPQPSLRGPHPASAAPPLPQQPGFPPPVPPVSHLAGLLGPAPLLQSNNGGNGFGDESSGPQGFSMPPAALPDASSSSALAAVTDEELLRQLWAQEAILKELRQRRAAAAAAAAGAAAHHHQQVRQRAHIYRGHHPRRPSFR